MFYAVRIKDIPAVFIAAAIFVPLLRWLVPVWVSNHWDSTAAVVALLLLVGGLSLPTAFFIWKFVLKYLVKQQR